MVAGLRDQEMLSLIDGKKNKKFKWPAGKSTESEDITEALNKHIEGEGGGRDGGREGGRCGVHCANYPQPCHGRRIGSGGIQKRGAVIR